MISITSIEPTNLVKNNVMKHSGIRYAVRLGIEREQWRVAIYPRGNGLATERTVLGTYEYAEIAARSMIDAWLRKRLELKKAEYLSNKD